MSFSTLLRRGSSLAIAAFVPLVGSVALAQDVAVRAPGGASASPLATLARLSLALALVLLAFWGCARLMRRLQRASESGGVGLRVVGGLSLGQRERLVVVQAGDEQLLLGVSAGRIERLHVLDTPLGGAEERPSRTEPVAPAASADFRRKLVAAMQRRVPS